MDENLMNDSPLTEDAIEAIRVLVGRNRDELNGDILVNPADADALGDHNIVHVPGPAERITITNEELERAFNAVSRNARDAATITADYTHAVADARADIGTYEPFANIAYADEILRGYDERMGRIRAYGADDGFTPREIESVIDEIRRPNTTADARRRLTLHQTPLPPDILHLEEGTEVRINISPGDRVCRKFCGYFDDSNMAAVCSSYITDDEIMISYPSETLVFKYREEVVTIPADVYCTRILVSQDIHELEHKIVVDIRTSDVDINIWNSGDDTVATKEPLVVMDQAFEEVFQ